MVQFWRAAGVSYIRYLSVCSKVLRSCLKEEHRKTAQIRDTEKIKFRQWSGGKKGKLGNDMKFSNLLFLVSLLFFDYSQRKYNFQYFNFLNNNNGLFVSEQMKPVESAEN
jgi:hypothetical protein